MIFQIVCDSATQLSARLKPINSEETSSASAALSVQGTQLCEVGEDRDSQPVRTDLVEPELMDKAGVENQIDSFMEEVVQEAIVIEKNKVSEKTDGLMNHTNHILVIEDLEVAPKTLEIENISVTTLDDSVADRESVDVEEVEDSWTDSETSESEDEFMADGERVRKTSRGFKQISNCKRFWKASLLTG